MWWNDEEDAPWVEPDTGTVGDSVGLANYGAALDSARRFASIPSSVARRAEEEIRE